MPLDVRACAETDLPLLRTHLHGGRPEAHDRRFEQQRRGESTYLIAWLDGIPVGHVKVRWSGSVHRCVADVLGDVPEIRRLRVASSARGSGVGSHLVAAAEAVVRADGHRSIGLAVALSSDAARLYDRLGYVEWTGGSFVSPYAVDDHGRRHEHVVTYLTKQLVEPVLDLRGPRTRDGVGSPVVVTSGPIGPIESEGVALVRS